MLTRKVWYKTKVHFSHFFIIYTLSITHLFSSSFDIINSITFVSISERKTEKAIPKVNINKRNKIQKFNVYADK